MNGWRCLLLLVCFRIGSGVDYICNSSLSVFKSFKIKVFFNLSEKQSIVLSKQPIVLYLGVFEKV